MHIFGKIGGGLKSRVRVAMAEGDGMHPSHISKVHVPLLDHSLIQQIFTQYYHALNPEVGAVNTEISKCTPSITYYLKSVNGLFPIPLIKGIS